MFDRYMGVDGCQQKKNAPISWTRGLIQLKFTREILNGAVAKWIKIGFNAGIKRCKDNPVFKFAISCRDFFII